jgi:hypothetical protein
VREIGTMSAVIVHFPFNTKYLGKKQNYVCTARVGPRNKAKLSTIELVSEAGKFAYALSQLASVNGSPSELTTHLTFRDEQRLMQNLETAVELLSRFAKELKLDVEQIGDRDSESLGKGNSKITS